MGPGTGGSESDAAHKSNTVASFGFDRGRRRQRTRSRSRRFRPWRRALGGAYVRNRAGDGLFSLALGNFDNSLLFGRGFGNGSCGLYNSARGGRLVLKFADEIVCDVKIRHLRAPQRQITSDRLLSRLIEGTVDRTRIAAPCPSERFAPLWRAYRSSPGRSRPGNAAKCIPVCRRTSSAFRVRPTPLDRSR